MQLASFLVCVALVLLCAKGIFLSGQLTLAGIIMTVMACGARQSYLQAQAPTNGQTSAKPRAVAASRRATADAAHAIPLGPLLLVVAVLVSEKFETQVRAVGHSAVPTYVACAFAYGCTEWFDLVRSANGSMATAERGLFVRLGFLTAVVAAALGALTLNSLVAGGLVAGVAVAFETFVQLRRVVTTVEAYLIASLAGLVAVDAVMNNTLADPAKISQLDVRVTASTSVEYLIGRACLVGAWLFAAACGRWTRHLGRAPSPLGHAAILVAAFVVPLAHVSWATGWLSASQAVNALAHSILGDPTTASAELPSLATTLSADAVMRFVDRHFRTVCVAAWAIAVPLACAAALAVPERLAPRVVRRKFFHFIAVAAFAVPTAVDPPFMACWWGIAVAGSTVVEVLRFNGVPGFRGLTRLFAAVIDERDPGVVRTHLFLMLGCALAPLLNHRERLHFAMAPAWYIVSWRDFLPGLGALGVLDAAAAVAGSQFGRRTLSSVLNPILPASWRKENAPVLDRKTVLGFVAGWVATAMAAVLPLAAVVMFDAFTTKPSFAVEDVTAAHWGALIGVSGLAALYEAVTCGVDNLELPMFVMVLSRLLLL